MATLRELFSCYPVDIDNCSAGTWTSCPLDNLSEAIAPGSLTGSLSRCNRALAVLLEKGITSSRAYRFVELWDSDVKKDTTPVNKRAIFKKVLDIVEPL